MHMDDLLTSVPRRVHALIICLLCMVMETGSHLCPRTWRLKQRIFTPGN